MNATSNFPRPYATRTRGAVKLVLAICFVIAGGLLALLFVVGDVPQTHDLERTELKLAPPQPVDTTIVSAPTESSERSSAALAELELTPSTATISDTTPRDPVDVLVVDKASGHPVAGAEVIWANISELESPLTESQPRWSRDPRSMPASARRATTDSSGVARIDSRVFPGRICARHDRSWGSTVTSTTPEQLVRVELAPDLGLVIQVVDGHDRPVTGVPVCVRDVPHLRSQGELWSGTTSGAIGTAAVPRLRHPRPRQIDRGRVYAMLELPTLEPVVVPVDLEQIPSEPVRLVLPPCGSVVIAMRNADGRPANADRVFLWLATDRSDVGNFVHDARPFEAERIQDGEAHYPFVGIGLDLLATAARAGAAARAQGPGPHTSGEVVRFELDLGQPPPVAIGRLVLESGEPLRERRIQTSLQSHTGRSSGRNHSVVRTDSDGRVRLSLPGTVGQPFSAKLTLVPEGIGLGEDTKTETEFQVDALTTEHDLGDIVVLTPRVVGTGVVVDDFGIPIPKTVLVLAHSSRDVEGGQWRSSSALESRMKPDGSFTILARSEVERVRVRAMRNDYANGQNVEFDPVRHDLRLVLPRACEISGYALIDGDIGPGRVRVIAFDHGVNPRTTAFTSERETYVDLDGRFRLKRLPPGRFDVEFRIGREGETLSTVAGVDVPPGGKAMDARLDAVNLLGRVPAEAPR